MLDFWLPVSIILPCGHFLVKKSKFGKEGSLMARQTRQIKTGKSWQSSSRWYDLMSSTSKSPPTSVATVVIFQFQQNILVTNEPVKRVKAYVIHLCVCVETPLLLYHVAYATYHLPESVPGRSVDLHGPRFLPVGPQKLPPLVAGERGVDWIDWCP